MKKKEFFEKMEKIGLALSYGDVRLKTAYSEVAPASVDLTSKFSRNVPVLAPMISAAMDTVTESKMAIALAIDGGLGIIHRGLSPKEQASEAARAKYYLNGLIKKPIFVHIGDSIKSILNRMEDKGYSFRSFPVLDSEGRVKGLLTGNDFEFCQNLDLTAGEIMSGLETLITAEENIAIEEASRIMQRNKKKILPIINKEGKLAGMYVYSDVKRIMTGGSASYNLDANGNLRVGAAIGVGREALERFELLSGKGVDAVVIDTAHGYSKEVLNTLIEIKKSNSSVDVVVGNVSTADAAKALVDAGADGIKIGQGPGSICTTRIVAGVGAPQVSAVYNCSQIIEGSDVPVCADGGIEYSGDIPIAIGAGASTVMLGQMLAGTKEAPGDIKIIKGIPYKLYRGMGSLAAMADSKAARERYRQAEGEKDKDKLVPEGVEGIVPYKGEVAKIIFQLLGGLRSGMGYVGAMNIKELQEKADFDRISPAGLSESHPHGIEIINEPPNYRLKR